MAYQMLYVGNLKNQMLYVELSIHILTYSIVKSYHNKQWIIFFRILNYSCYFINHVRTRLSVPYYGKLYALHI